MTPADLRQARATLGHMWGFGRPLRKVEMGRALGLSESRPGQSVTLYETGKRQISTTAAYLVSVYLSGALPPCGLDRVRG